jgi:hypothetical protein
MLPIMPVAAVLGGRLPASFARLRNLRMLMLEHNYLTGSLPDLCGSLTQLEVKTCCSMPVALYISACCAQHLMQCTQYGAS